MVSDYEAFKLYTAVKLHFTSNKYDVFTYNGRVNCPYKRFEARNDRMLFARIADRFNTPKDLIEYYVANFAYGNSNVIYDRELAEDNYKTWLKRKETRNYDFSKQMQVLYNYVDRNKITYHDLFKTDEGAPLLLQLYLSNTIHLETLIIIDEFENYLQSWDSLILIWNSQLTLFDKVKRFVRYDKSKIQLTYYKHKAEIQEIYHGSHY